MCRIIEQDLDQRLFAGRESSILPIEMTTAVSAPFFVMICGSPRDADAMTSLNLFLPSKTEMRFILAS